ncbi:hypothetical protein F4779DRAFT_498879 [Xylariaceae sp. FL0662B]|nr:hypothetical protein F4779DRAFT_498879 [Xylariaceae sp. FL0662B]
MRLHLFLLLIGVLFCHAVAASAPTFCKCSCFKNSTLIQLGPQGDSTDSTSPSGSGSGSGSGTASQLRSVLSKNNERAASASCTQCTRAFCLAQNLPICRDAEEENDVVAMCFQRDSRKDQIIVWGFILGTAGLLGWAAAKRVIELRESRKAAAAAAGLGLSGAGGRRAVPPGTTQAPDRGAYMPVGEGRGSPG